MLSCWRSGRKGREGKECAQPKESWCWRMGLTPREWELLLLRTWKEGPLFPTAAASMFHFLSIIGVIYCRNHHLLQGLLSTMLGINKELAGTSCSSGG